MNRECAVPDRAVALNLQVLGRGLAAIGNLFVFDGLSFIERRETSLLNRRNVNENVLAAIAGLDETITLGRIEPLHRTFSHSRRLRGIKKQKRTTGPRTHRPARGEDTRVGANWVAQTIAEIWQKWGLWHRISAFLPDSRSFK